MTRCKVAVPLDAVTYAHKAVLLPHPFDVLPKERDFVETISANLQLSPSQLKLDRIGKVKQLLNMKAELHQADAALRDQMAPSVARVLNGKSLALLDKL
eukprot:4502691-Amphidinium_carterae.1